MDRQEFARLLSQTQSIMAAARAGRPFNGSDSCNQPTATPLSPRQKFQAHVRTLSENSSPVVGNAPASPRRSPELHHISSLRVQSGDIASLRNRPRPLPVHEAADRGWTSGRGFQNEPYFIAEEREAWSRRSPTRGRSEEVYLLQPPEEASPVRQPSKQTRELRPFAPLAQPADVSERPKTSRGPQDSRSGFLIDEENDLADLQDQKKRNSKFAEGSMTNRSAGISSSWLQHEPLSSLSAEESDHDSTPRASPNRASSYLDEFKPPAVTPATIKKRLFRLSSAFKSSDASKKTPEEPQMAKKRKGLRKSISMWNIGERRKTVDGSVNEISTKKGAPNEKFAESAKGQDVDVLNDRKRRADEAYAQQFGTKRRKSHAGDVPISDEQSTETSTVGTEDRQRNLTSTHLQRSSSRPLVAGSDVSDSHSDLDHYKRPSRRELEKENQQLRALLRQQQEDPRLRANIPQPPAPSRPLPQVPQTGSSPTTAPPRKPPTKKKTQKTLEKEIPPVPAVPDRVALQNLSNARYQPKVKTDNSNDSPKTTSNTNVHSDTDHKKKLALLSARAADPLPRPVSIILEEDEEGLENRDPSPCPSPKKGGDYEGSDVDKIKVQEHIAAQMKGVRREQWEWPDDVF